TSCGRGAWTGDESLTPSAAGRAMQFPNQSDFCCLIRLIAEEDGFSIYSPSLPGAASQGDTEAEAVANIKEAIVGLIESYMFLGKEIPWEATPEACPEGEQERWINIHA